MRVRLPEKWEETPASKKTSPADRLPWINLAALALAGFLAIMAEAVPAGLLIPIGADLRISKGGAGQLVTAYALGSLLCAIPIMRAASAWDRKKLLMLGMFVLSAANAVTALSSSYAVILAARFCAGVAAALLWGMLAGYTRFMVAEHLRGRALAVAMSGTPLALAFGVPLGTFIGGLWGWRAVFGIISLIALLLAAWISRKFASVPGQPSNAPLSLRQAFVTPGVRPILITVVAWMLAHNILYTYIAPYLALSGLDGRVDRLLLLFGSCAILGIWLIGIGIDRRLRQLVLSSLAGFALSALALGIWSDRPVVVSVAIAAWGITFGGAATLLQTAAAEAAGSAVDLVQAMLVTAWNLAIGSGGVVGALLLQTGGAERLPTVCVLVALGGLLTAATARTHGFPLRSKG
ncbi:MFS transporter [Saccharibacillus sacchari]|uniref:MFS transporter n=1 Tax=Saccharibacillus sacchari TaxID=456493 RepID=A0ACC6PG39_9BACL